MMNPVALELANTELLKADIPSVVFIALVMVIGIIGNIHAILVYGFFYRKGNHRNYILWLSTFDLLGCCITMPLVILRYVSRYTFPSEINCKLFMSFTTFIAGYSLALLDIIAADRYRRITSPLKKQLSHRGAQIACTITCLTFIVLSLPNLVNVHVMDIEIPTSNITGYACHINNSDFFFTVYTIIQSVIVSLLFISCIVLYTLILCSLTSQGRARSARIGRLQIAPGISSTITISDQQSTSMTSTSAMEMLTLNTNPAQICPNEQSQQNRLCGFSLSVESTNKDLSKSNDKSELKRKESEMKNDIGRNVRNASKNSHLTKGRRITIMFMIVSFGACVVYLPTMVQRLLTVLNYGQLIHDTLHGWGGVFSYFALLNHAINPIVYGFLDNRFRQKCKNMYLRLSCKIPKII